jgi:polar amino acid transport system permease protein
VAGLAMPGWVWPVARAMGRGLLTTAELSLLGSVAGILLGVVLGVALAGQWAWLRHLVRLYVELWRGLPLLVILFFAFFALPAAGLRLTGFAAASVGLTFWASAVMADNVRGAIQSVPPTQMDAARALGLRWVPAMFLVILPQAMRRLLPPTLNMLTSLIHGTSLAAQLGVLELLDAGRRSSQRLVLDDGDSHSLAIFAAVLVMFFAICYPLMALSRWLEKRSHA